MACEAARLFSPFFFFPGGPTLPYEVSNVLPTLPEIELLSIVPEGPKHTTVSSSK